MISKNGFAERVTKEPKRTFTKATAYLFTYCRAQKGSKKSLLVLVGIFQLKCARPKRSETAPLWGKYTGLLF